MNKWMRIMSGDYSFVELLSKGFYKLVLNPIYLYVKYLFVELFHPKKILLIRAISMPNNKGILPKFELNNIGDDINYVLAPLVFDRYMVPYQYSIIGRYLFRRDHVLFIGSIITALSMSKSIVLGAGLSPDQTSKPMIPPKKVKCVRGPLTREYLREKGIDCPPIYGDPALLLPLFYIPCKKSKYKIGFIPHFLDKTNEVLELLSRYEQCVVLDVQNYVSWRQFIDTLCSCELILSSSLHGLIFADAYDIPNVWVHYSFEVNPFKYRDYFLSVNRKDEMPYNLISYTPIESLMALKNRWTAISFDKQRMLDYLRHNMPC